MSSTPYRMPEPESRGGTATVGKSVKIIGQIFTKEDLYVDGDVEGTIESLENKVTVGPNGRVQAGIKAREVIILGQVQGNVETSDKVDLRKDAKLVGDITTARISIEDGAIFKGSIDIRKPEPKPAAAPASLLRHRRTGGLLASAPPGNRRRTRDDCYRTSCSRFFAGKPLRSPDLTGPSRMVRRSLSATGSPCASLRARSLSLLRIEPRPRAVFLQHPRCGSGFLPYSISPPPARTTSTT